MYFTILHLIHILFWTPSKAELSVNTKTSLQLYIMRKKKYWQPEKRLWT
jgi:hypothetical protein